MDSPGPLPVPETNERESKNHIIKAGAKSPSCAYTGTPVKASIRDLWVYGEVRERTVIAIAVRLGTDV